MAKSSLSIQKVFDLAVAAGGHPDGGKKMTQNYFREKSKQLEKAGFFIAESSDYEISESVRDLVLRKSISDQSFDSLVALHEKIRHYGSADPSLTFLQAFYKNDREELARCFKGEVAGSFAPLDPFDLAFYETLDGNQRQKFFVCSIPRWVSGQIADQSAIEAIDSFLENDPALSPELSAAVLDWGIACGDIEMLSRFNQATGGKCLDVPGCIAATSTVRQNCCANPSMQKHPRSTWRRRDGCQVC